MESPPTNKVIKFVSCYLRVSTSNQEKQNTIQNQAMVLEEHAKKNGYIIVEKYLDEGWSGDTLIRPELDRLRLDAKDRKWDAVLMYDPDRLARRYSYQELIIDELREKEIAVIFLTTSSPVNEEDKLLYGVKGLFSQYERHKISERFRLGKLRTVREGHVIGSDAPYGYKYVRKNKENGIFHGFYEIVEDEARVMRMIFNWIADEGETLRGVVKRLQTLGIKPRKSKRGVWSTSTLSTLLKNKALIGEAQWGKSYAIIPKNPHTEEKYKKNKKSSRKMRAEEEWIQISVPAIINPEVFKKVRARLEKNFALSKRNRKNEYLLAGKIWCVCGKRRCGCGPSSSSSVYYRCNDRVMNFPLPRDCKEGGLNAAIADQLVWGKVSKLMSSPGLMRKQIHGWMSNSKNKTKMVFVDTEIMKKEISSLKEKEDRYNKAYADGIFTLAKLKEYTAPLHEKVVSLEYQILVSKQQEEDIRTSVPSPYEIEDFAKTAVKILKDLSFQQKRAIVENIIDKIVGNQEKIQIYGHIPINPNVAFCSSYRNCGVTKRREIDPF